MIDATTTLRGRKHLVEPERGRDEVIMHRAMRVLDRVRDPGRGRDVGPGSQVAEEGERGPQPVPEGGGDLIYHQDKIEREGGGQQAREEEEIKQRGGKKDRTEAEKKEGGKRDRTEVEKKERQKGSRGERGREEEGKKTT